MIHPLNVRCLKKRVTFRENVLTKNRFLVLDDLVKLLITLTAINSSLMSSNHVPLLISSYRATLSKCDQAIFQVNWLPLILLEILEFFFNKIVDHFQLLRWYEDNGIRFSDCRPYLWGDAAVTHHSIRTEISVSLKRQPLPNQVLELFDNEIIKNTIRYFPLDRSLKVSVCGWSFQRYLLPFGEPAINAIVLYKNFLKIFSSFFNF